MDTLLIVLIAALAADVIFGFVYRNKLNNRIKAVEAKLTLLRDMVSSNSGLIQSMKEFEDVLSVELTELKEEVRNITPSVIQANAKRIQLENKK